MNAFGEMERVSRYIQRELDAQAERLKVRRVIARRADGIDEVLNIIETVTDNGITVVVQAAPRPESGAQYKQLEALIVEVIRRCGVKGGVAPETYGAMCEGVREILRLAGPDAP